MDKKIRAATVERAAGSCECCFAWGGDDLQYDHARGRARSESLESGWMICATCHFRRTNNIPSAAKNLERWMAHCALYNYREEVRLAENRLAVLKQKGMA